METIDRLIYMTNQIARNFGTRSDAEAADATAKHIVRSWTPRVIEKMLKSDRTGLTSVGAEAIRQVEATKSAPAA